MRGLYSAVVVALMLGAVPLETRELVFDRWVATPS